MKEAEAMAAHADDATASLPLRLLVPPALWSMLTAALVLMKRRAQEPTVPPMSEQWLREYAAQERPDEV